MTTIQDIADKLNISKGTVSKALNNAPDISESLQKQILETAVELGYIKMPDGSSALLFRRTISNTRNLTSLPMTF